jgi:hypothetical protein
MSTYDDMLTPSYLMSSYHKMIEYEDILCRFDEKLRQTLAQRSSDTPVYLDLFELKMYLDRLIDESGVPNPLYKDSEHDKEEA